jgi:hypothetical protein
MIHLLVLPCPYLTALHRVWMISVIQRWFDYCKLGTKYLTIVQKKSTSERKVKAARRLLIQQ